MTHRHSMIPQSNGRSIVHHSHVETPATSQDSCLHYLDERPRGHYYYDYMVKVYHSGVAVRTTDMICLEENSGGYVRIHHPQADMTLPCSALTQVSYEPLNKHTALKFQGVKLIYDATGIKSYDLIDLVNGDKHHQCLVRTQDTPQGHLVYFETCIIEPPKATSYGSVRMVTLVPTSSGYSRQYVELPNFRLYNISDVTDLITNRAVDLDAHRGISDWLERL